MTPKLQYVFPEAQPTIVKSIFGFLLKPIDFGGINMFIYEQFVTKVSSFM